MTEPEETAALGVARGAVTGGTRMGRGASRQAAAARATGSVKIGELPQSIEELESNLSSRNPKEDWISHVETRAQDEEMNSGSALTTAAVTEGVERNGRTGRMMSGMWRGMISVREERMTAADGGR